MDNGGWDHDLPTLVQAAARGQLARVRELLASGSSPDERDAVGWSALQAACTREHWAVARLLLDEGAIARVDEAGRSPLVSAASGGELDLVKRLASAGVPLIGAVDAAACDGQLHVLQWLVEETDADVDEDEEGLTPLINAAEAGQVEAVRELIRLGADRTQEYDGKSIADLAEGMGYPDLAAELRGEVLVEPRLEWMKWFNWNWHGDTDPEDTKAIQASYAAHLAELVPKLPPDIRCLAEAGGSITLHDGHVLLTSTRRTSG